MTNSFVWISIFETIWRCEHVIDFRNIFDLTCMLSSNSLLCYFGLRKSACTCGIVIPMVWQSIIIGTEYILHDVDWGTCVLRSQHGMVENAVDWPLSSSAFARGFSSLDKNHPLLSNLLSRIFYHPLFFSLSHWLS